MRRRGPLQMLASSPPLVGAVTTLVTIVVVFLAYNANQGLPFVPVYRVSVEIPDAARLGASNEVRIGGSRVGVVDSIEPVRASAPEGAAASGSGTDAPPGDVSRVAARLNLRLDRSVQPLPRDSIFRIRYKSTFGFKYLEIVRGTGPPATDGFTFVGTDDRRGCKLPEQPEAFSAEIPDSARNGCFHPQTEFDEIGNALDAPTRANLRDVLVGQGDALAGRGISLNLAIEKARPLLQDLRPVAATLADPGTNLERLILALRRTAAAVGPVSEQAAGLFSNAAVALEAVSRDPIKLEETISEAVPLLTEGIPQLHRQQALFADTAELFRRLGPGARQLPVAAPLLNDALEIGTPVLGRVPRAADDLREVLAELRRAVDQPSTKLSLNRLRETLGSVRPLAARLVPAQTVCNYWNYWFTFLPEHLSERSTIGFTERTALVQSPPGPGAVSIGGAPFDPPSTARAPLGGYSGEPSDGLAGPVPNPAEEGVFKPHELPIARAPILAPYGVHARVEGRRPVAQLTDEFPDCASGQFGYALGRLPLPGQRPADPQIGVGDYPGSLGPTTLFFDEDGNRRLRDTRVRSRSPKTWGIFRR